MKVDTTESSGVASKAKHIRYINESVKTDLEKTLKAIFEMFWIYVKIFRFNQTDRVHKYFPYCALFLFISISEKYKSVPPALRNLLIH